MAGIAKKLAFCAASFGAGIAWGLIAEAAEYQGSLSVLLLGH
ncbi:MAG: hypothetical protein R3C08_05320 [Hyphomonas sp.]|nr:hypothetical protein [Hyphomonas sp.]HRX73355.1 hypothetical protein [Hyphomonas sp.]